MSVNAVDKSTGNLIKTAGNPVEDASGIHYSHTTSGLAATNVQDAIDESYASLKSGLTTLDTEVNGDATVYPYADVITIEDAVPANVADCNVKIEPVQDLHGQSAPYVGGAGKNKLPLTLDNLKSVNPTGTWADNVFSLNGVNFTVNIDNDGNVTGITANGTASANTNFFFVRNSPNIYSGYILNGCVGGSSNSYYMALSLNASPWTTNTCFNSDTTITIPETATIESYIRVANGYVANNVVFYPMLRLSTETDATFAPYTNICPISGHTEASVTRTGKNILDVSTYTANKYLGASGNEVDANSYAISKFIRVKQSTQYVASGVSSVNGTYMAFYDADKNFLSSMAETADGFTFTTPNNASYVKLSLRNVTLNIPQLEEGSTATPYIPYAGQTYTIQLGDTIYGGTVDFDSGVMTVTHKYVEFSGGETETWTSASDRPHSFSHAENLGIVDAWSRTDITMISNQFIQNGEVAYYGSNYRIGYTNSGTLYVGMPNIDNVADFKTYLSNNHLQIVGTLATPFTVQLTPQQIQLLKGTNTLYASTGQISVTVNGVSGAIGAVQEQVNDHEERIEAVESGLTNLDVALNVPDGTGKNLFVLTIDHLKSLNTAGTWNDNVYTVASVSFTVNSDTDGNIVSISANGTATGGEAKCYLSRSRALAKYAGLPLVINGCTGGSYTTYMIQINKYNGSNNAYAYTGDSNQFIPTENVNYGVIVIRENVAVTNQLFYPMLRYAAIEDDTFVPYIPSVESRIKSVEAAIPDAPTTDGAYVLTVTVASGTPTYSWVSTT